MLIGFDFAVATLAVFGAGWLRWGSDFRWIWENTLGLPDVRFSALGFGVLVIALYWATGNYQSNLHWSIEAEIVQMLKGFGLTFAATLSLLFWFKLQDTSRVMLGWLFLGLAIGGTAARVLLRAVNGARYRRGSLARNVLLVGSGPAARPLLDRTDLHTTLGAKFVGYLDDEPRLAELPHLGSPDRLPSVLADTVVDEVVFCLAADSWYWLDPLTRVCREQGKTAHVAIDIAGHAISHGTLQDFDGVPLLTLANDPSHQLALAAKRLIDIGLSLVILVLVSPIMAAAALAVALEDGRPLVFAQRRGRLHGREFRLWKLRTMVLDAEEQKAGLMVENERVGPAFKITDDPRVTRVGRFLRKTSIDELPQLFNVLRGEMSLVGPRPQPIEEVQAYDFWHRRRLSMKPGITGLWQVTARHDNDFDRWVDLDLQYIDRWSLWLDFVIILKTPLAMVRTPGV
jgi:exopolysaccharide biosynthesis polyprenyl glycosylphosphotransferase